ncbi:translocation/assembly module TamB domain-containing protein [Neomegalonema perideroedes]|uniref:translocation/assembly module TamB domain-containing protein n=1 Tax=Neomegalonema perideroedes TaxID=217219 RepID=UPI00035C7959|nr:translocation/assembly module TamB domain-containing protein [Neomegalonema perideroedes]
MTQRQTILRSGAAGLALSLSLGWTTPASAFLDTEGAWNDVLQFAVRQINAPGEFEIELGRVTRPEDGFARIETLSLKDGDGEWVTAKGIVIDWRVRSLLRARFNFQTLSAEEINVLRAPIGRGDPPGEEAQVSFAWPRPPTSLTIDKLRIDKLTVSDKLAPQALQAKVEGSFSDVGDDQTASLTVTRTDGRRGEFKFSGDLDFDEGKAKLSLAASEQAGGLVATAAGLPAGQDVELTFTADGGFESLPFQIGGRIGEMGAATGEGSVAFRGPPAVTFSGAIAPDERASATWRRALGERSTLTFDGRQTANGGYELNAFRVESPILEAEGAGVLSPGSSDSALKISWRARDVAAFNAVIAPTRFTAMQGEAEITGDLKAPTAHIDAVVEGLQGDFGAVGRIGLKIDAAPPAGASAPAGGGIADSRFTAQIGATGFAPKDPALLEALGAEPTLDLRGQWRAAQSVAAIEALTLRAEGLQMDGQGAFDVGTKLFDGSLTGVSQQIAPFARLAGIDLSGAADFNLTVEKAGAEGVHALQLETGLRGLDSSDPNIKAALGEEATITLDVAESSPGVMRVAKGGISSASLAADFSGEISPAQDRVDLAIDWRVTDPQALAGFAPGLSFAAAAGQAAVTGTLSEPQFRTTAQVDDPKFQQYGALSVALEAEGQTRKDRRAPFSFTAEIRQPDLGDPNLTSLAGETPRLEGRGIHDMATGLLTVDEIKAALAAGEATISGEANLTERAVNMDLTADLPDLAVFSALAPEPVSGSGRLTVEARGSLDAPRINLDLAAQAPRYGKYGADEASLKGSATLRPSGALPFDLNLALNRPSLGDEALEETIGPNPTFSLEGSFDPAAQKLNFASSHLTAAPGEILVKGEVDLAGREMDLELDTEGLNLASLSPLAGGAEMGGEIRASISLAGAFDKPMIGVKGGGVDIFYEQYRLSELEVEYGPTPRADGGFPFTATAALDGAPLDDPNLRRVLGGKPRIRATGSFNPETGRVALDSARVTAAVGQIDLKGRIETKAQTLDVTFDADVKNLALLSGYAGGDLSGAFKGSGSAKGSFTQPSVALKGEATKFAFDGRGADRATLTATAAPQANGALNFEADLKIAGPNLGDEALEALLGDPSVTTKGSFDPESGLLRLTSTHLETAMGGADLSGTVNAKTMALDLRFAADLDDIAPLSAKAGQRLGGALKAEGRLTGEVSAPRLLFDATGENLVFDRYGAQDLTISARTTPGSGGVVSFEAEVEARGPLLGDPQLEALLGDVALKTVGSFNPSSGLLRLETAEAVTGAGSAKVSGRYGTKDQSLALDFDADIRNLAPFSGLAGETLAGSLKAEGRVEGEISAPKASLAAQGEGLRYGAYGAAALDVNLSAAPNANGALSFTATGDVRSPRIGDPELDALIGDVKLNARGSFNQKTGLLRLEPGEITTGLGVAKLSGQVGTKAQTLALDFDVDARNLAPFSRFAGETLGGSLKAAGRVEGSFTAPKINATAQGQSLQYGQYGAASLNLDVSSSPVADGTMGFSVAGDVRSPRIGDPQLDAAIGDVTLNAKGSFNQTTGLLKLEPGEISTGLGSARASGFFGTKDQTIGLDFNLDARDLGPLSGLAGEALGGALKASGRVEGGLKAPRVNATAEAQSLQYGKYGLAGLNLKLTSAPGADGTIPFSVEAQAVSPRLGDPQLEALLGNVTLNAQGSFNPESGMLRLEPGEVTTSAVGSARVSGFFGTKDQTLGLDFSANLANLAPFSSLAGETLGGAISASGRVDGGLKAPRVSLTAQGQSLQYGQYALAGLNLKASSAPQPDGTIPFSVEAQAAGPRFGDPQLEALLGNVSLNAQGSFNPTTGLLRLEPGEVSTGAGAARVSGFFGTKDQTLGLDFSANLGNLAPFSALAGETLGGSLSASGRVEGSLKAPSVSLAAQGQNLQYGKYGIAGLNLNLSGAPQPDGTIPFTVSAQARGPRMGDPQLDALIGDVNLSANGSFNPTTGLLRLEPGEATAGLGSARVSGFFGTKDQSLGLDFSANIGNLAPFSQLAGETLGGAFSASGRIDGTISAPRLNATAQGQSLQYGQYGLAGLNLNLSSSPQPDGSIPFSAQARLSGPRMGDPRIEQLLGEANLSAQGAYNPSTRQLLLNPAEVQMAAGSLRAAGQVDLANQAMALDVTADLPNLAPLSGFAGAQISGAGKLDARIEGPFADPSARGSASLRALAYDGRPIGDAQAQFNLTRLVSAPQGEASLSAQTPQGPLTASARFASQNGQIQLDHFRLEGLGLFGEGRLNMASGGLMEGSALLSSASLGPIGALLGYEASGALDANLSFSGQTGRQTILARGAASNLRIAQNGDFLAGITSLNFNAQIDDAFGADPYVRADLDGQRLEAAGILLTDVRSTLQGPLSDLDVAFDGTGDLLDEGLRELDSFSLQARVNAAGGFKGVTLHRFNGRISGEDLMLAQAVELRPTADGGFGFQNLDLRLGASGMLGGYLTYAPSGSFGHLVLHNLPLRLLSLAGLPPAEGHLFGEAQMDSRQNSGSFNLRTEGMTMIEAGLNSPIQADAQGSWSGAQLTAALTMTSASFRQPLQANARLTLLPGGGIPMPDRNGPISAQASWAGDLGEVWPLLPLPDHLLSGSATLSATLEGSLAAPRTAGGLQIQGGRYENLEYGTVVQNLGADATFSADGRLTLTAQGNDGYGGQISAMGSYVLSSRALDATVRVNRMAAARRDDLTAIVSGEVTARGDAASINVNGRIDNDFLEFRLIGGGAPNLVVIEATPVGLSAPRTPRRAAGAAAGNQRINLNLVVNIPGQAYVRGRGLESEWGGQLQVTGHAGAPRVSGMIEKRRGWLDLLGRQFDLEIGEVRFSGDLDPYVTVRLTAEANDIRGWLQVAGYSSDPKISFGSDQGLPEEEVLPRLLFGRSKQSLSAIEAAQLAAGVATLMSGRPGAMDMLRDVAGVDTLRIEEGANGGTAISTGKYIADGVFVGARQDLGTGGTTALVEIETFSNIVIDAEIGAEETKAGINWKMDY